MIKVKNMLRKDMKEKMLAEEVEEKPVLSTNKI